MFFTKKKHFLTSAVFRVFEEFYNKSHAVTKGLISTGDGGRHDPLIFQPPTCTSSSPQVDFFRLAELCFLTVQLAQSGEKI